jgi:hypothetical protein
MIDHVGLDVGDYSNGEPGLRSLHHENDYGAHVFDPDGNDVEAVCHSVP